ncbi:hypothetical protein M6C35_001977 [Vibrio metschnikovii]|nr:hypothetical protein [Vibrio metschnikovii]
MTQSRLERLLSEALGYDVDLTPTRLTRRKRLENKLEKLEERLIARITKGRTKGAGLVALTVTSTIFHIKFSW